MTKTQPSGRKAAIPATLVAIGLPADGDPVERIVIGPHRGKADKPKTSAESEPGITAAAAAAAAPKTKIAILVELLRRPEGAGVEELTAATGWQVHSVRGAISGAIKKTLGLTIQSEKVDGVRRYRIVEAGE